MQSKPGFGVGASICYFLLKSSRRHISGSPRFSSKTFPGTLTRGDSEGRRCRGLALRDVAQSNPVEDFVLFPEMSWAACAERCSWSWDAARRLPGWRRCFVGAPFSDGLKPSREWAVTEHRPSSLRRCRAPSARRFPIQLHRYGSGHAMPSGRDSLRSPLRFSKIRPRGAQLPGIDPAAGQAWPLSCAAAATRSGVVKPSVQAP